MTWYLAVRGYAFVSPLSQTYHILLSSVTIIFYGIALYEHDEILYKKCAKYSKRVVITTEYKKAMT
jgi:hypothetical protein